MEVALRAEVVGAPARRGAALVWNVVGRRAVAVGKQQRPLRRRRLGVQGIRVPTKFDSDGKTILDDRPLVVAIVKGTEKPPADADLVAWSCE